MRRLYVLCRKDLGIVYSAVQGAHAVAQHCIDCPDSWNNEYLIFLTVEDEKELVDWYNNLLIKGKKLVPFYEPDLDDELTAIAVVDKGECFRSLPVL